MTAKLTMLVVHGASSSMFLGHPAQHWIRECPGALRTRVGSKSWKMDKVYLPQNNGLKECIQVIGRR
jgi:hypothetical protein